MEIRRCANCMEDMISVSGEICPKCKFDNSGIVEQPVIQAMPVETILHGRYLIGRVLGQGGFGITYIGYDLSLDVKVAIKEFFPVGMAERDRISSDLIWNQDEDDTQQRLAGYENFQKEARKIAKIDSIPSIVRVRDVFYDHETAYIVMDYVEGMTLKTRIQKNGPMAFSECIRILTPMMNDLEKVHQLGLIHRDISPDNIIIGTDGNVKLLDLGAAMDVSMGPRMQSQLVAKKGFSPLEQYTGEGKIGPWTDVYALCATIYYCITGKTIPSALDRMNKQAISYPANRKESIKPEQKAALEAGLELDSRKRIQTVSQLQNRIGRTKASFPWKKLTAAAGGIVAVGLLIFFFAGNVFRLTPSVTVEQTGTGSSDLFNSGLLGAYPGESEFIVGADQGLYLCKYDQDDQTFYLGDRTKIADWAAYITLGSEKAYFMGQDQDAFSICSVDKEGEKIEKICTSEDKREYVLLQYAGLSDGREYLYYLLVHERGGALCDLYRYDLKTEEEELLVEGNLCWFNLYGDSLYYIQFSNEQYEDCSVVKCGLDGEEPQSLITGRNVVGGFIEEDTLYLFSFAEESLIPFALDGEPKDEMKGFYDIQIDPEYTIAYLDGWILYTSKEDGSLHRIRANGTGDTLFLNGHTASQIIDVDNGYFFSWESAPTGQSGQSEEKIYMAYRDGTYYEDTGLNSHYSWGLPYIVNKEDLEYQDAEDGSGVVITGCTTSETSFEIPDTLDGKPVIGIAREAFWKSSIEQIGFPEGLRFIETNAFYECTNLSFIGLPGTLESIGDGAFTHCVNLTQVDLPDNLEKIGLGAFCETSLSEVYIPAKVSDLGAGAFILFADSGLQQYEVDEANEKYWSEDGALFGRTEEGVALMAVPSVKSGVYTIPEGTEILEDYCFAHSANLTGVEIPSSVKLIKKIAFWDVPFREISVSENCRLEDKIVDNSDGEAIKVSYY